MKAHSTKQEYQHSYIRAEQEGNVARALGTEGLQVKRVLLRSKSQEQLRSATIDISNASPQENAIQELAVVKTTSFKKNINKNKDALAERERLLEACSIELSRNIRNDVSLNKYNEFVRWLEHESVLKKILLAFLLPQGALLGLAELKEIRERRENCTNADVGFSMHDWYPGQLEMKR